MLRPLLSYALTSIILLSQTGLPVHMHYCKGMLETVSVFFNLGCSDHAEKKAATCCKPETINTPSSDTACCSAITSSCCDDEVALLLHDFDSLLPQFEKWDSDVVITSFSFHDFGKETLQSEYSVISSFRSDGGPPIYIMYGSLIFYA